MAYDFRDENKELLYQTVRYEPKDFRQRRPDGQGGWDWKLNGTPRVPYRLPELLTTNQFRTVLIVEGEKDCDRLAGLGLTATTNSGGAGKWRDEYNQYFAGRKVAILPDNDEPGRRHAQQVAESLQTVGASVKIVELPGIPEKGDVSDWLDAGGTIDELRNIVNATAVFEPVVSTKFFINYSDFMAQTCFDTEEIALNGAGELALVQSITNRGKSTFCRVGSFSLAAGRKFLTVAPGGAARRVLLINFEGSRGRFQSDLRVMERVFDEGELALIRKNFIVAHAPEIDEGEPLNLSLHIKFFETQARAAFNGDGPEVIVIDTASQAFTIRNESDNSEINN